MYWIWTAGLRECCLEFDLWIDFGALDEWGNPRPDPCDGCDARDEFGDCNGECYV